MRGVVASFRGLPMENRYAESVMDVIRMMVVVDAKDVFDKCSSDSTYGSQKSLAFAVAWMRSILRRPGTSLKWTATENVIADGGTKVMDMHHLRTTLDRGRWSVKFNTDFIKGKSKVAKKKAEPCVELPGEPMCESHPVFPYVHQLADRPGWHFEDDLIVQVARHARSFRSPKPRVDVKLFPLRSTFGRFDLKSGASEWRTLEEAVELESMSNWQSALGTTAAVLCTVFMKLPIHNPKRKEDSLLNRAPDWDDV